MLFLCASFIFEHTFKKGLIHSVTISILILFWKLVINSQNYFFASYEMALGRILGGACDSDMVSESLESLMKNKVREQLWKPVYRNYNKITENTSTKKANSFSQGSTVEGLRNAQDECGMDWVSTFNLTCIVTGNLVFRCHIRQGVRQITLSKWHDILLSVATNKFFWQHFLPKGVQQTHDFCAAVQWLS